MITATEAAKTIVQKFAEENLDFTENCLDYITCSDLYQLFNQWCKKNHYRNCTRICFTKNMQLIEGSQYLRIREPKKGAKFNPVWVFRYIKLRC